MDEELQQDLDSNEETTEVASEENAPSPVVKSTEPESVEETIKKSISELKQSEEPKEDEEPKAKPSRKTAKTKAEESESEDEEIKAPNDWTAQGKEAFKKYDKATQKEISRLSKEYQAYRQREINNFVSQKRAFDQEQQHFKSIKDTVARFLPHWGRQGITAEAALSEVCAFYTHFMSDPATALEEMGRQAGLRVQVEGAKRQQENVDPRINYLTERLGSVENMISTSQQQAIEYQTQQLGDYIDQEFEALKDEEAQPGKFKYPDLHNPQFCKEHIEPLVIGLAKANPMGANYGELIKRAYIASGGRVIPSQVSTRLNGHGRNGAAQRAAASMSGIGGGTPDTGNLPFVPNESVEDTIRRSIAFHRSR